MDSYTPQSMSPLPIRALHLALVASMPPVAATLLLGGDIVHPCSHRGRAAAAPVAGAVSATPASPSSPAAPATPASTVSPALSGTDADKILVVWESNRSGEFRIWRQDIPGGEPRQISPEEPGRDHCCAKLSPDGSRLVYLSLPGGARKYAQDAGPLHLVDADGGRDRILVPAARHYGEHRAAVWWGEDELVYIDGRSATQLLRLSAGSTTELIGARAASATAHPGEGWLVAPGGQVVSGNTPTFSDHTEGEGVRIRPSLGGCQPAFSLDGRFAVWSAGAGGPIDALDLATRRSWTVLEKGDPHLPAGRGYSYFPALSNDASLLAVGASAGEHDHFRADYDIYVLELDPSTLLPAPSGANSARVVAPHPGVDRFPDLYRPARPVDRAGARGVQASGTSATAVPAAAEPHAGDALTRRGLVFLWQRADAENRVAADSSSETLQPQGLAWVDRHRALALGGGSFSAAEETARRLAETLVAKHQMTLSLLVTPASLRERGAIVAFSDGPRARNFVLRQEGDQVVFALRTSDSAKEGLAVPVARLAHRPHRPPRRTCCSPSRPGAWPSSSMARARAPPRSRSPCPGTSFTGGPAPSSSAPKRSPRSAGTARSPRSPSGIAHFRRPRSPPRRRASRRSSPRARLRRGPSSSCVCSPPRRRRRSRRSRPTARPSWSTSSRSSGQISGPPVAAPRIRVARWAILDGQMLAPPRVGEVRRLVVEPFAAQPQLEPFYLADRLPAASGHPLYFDLGATSERPKPAPRPDRWSSARSSSSSGSCRRRWPSTTSRRGG